MEGSRLPLFRRRTSKSPTTSPPGPHRAPSPMGIHGNPPKGQQKGQVDRRDGNTIDQATAVDKQKTCEKLSTITQLQRQSDLDEISNGGALRELIVEPTGKPGQVTGKVVGVLTDWTDRDGVEQSRETPGYIPDRPNKLLPPKPVQLIMDSEQSSLNYDPSAGDNAPLSKDLLQVSSVNGDNYKLLEDGTILMPPPRARKYHTRAQSTTSESSNSPHHDYVELDYAVVYEECMSSPDYTELNPQSSSSSDKSQSATSGESLARPGEPGTAEGHYSKLSDVRREVEAIEACQDKRRGEESCDCSCCVDINDALSEGDVEGTDTDGLANGDGTLVKRDTCNLLPGTNDHGAIASVAVKPPAPGVNAFTYESHTNSGHIYGDQGHSVLDTESENCRPISTEVIANESSDQPWGRSEGNLSKLHSQVDIGGCPLSRESGLPILANNALCYGEGVSGVSQQAFTPGSGCDVYNDTSVTCKRSGSRNLRVNIPPDSHVFSGRLSPYSPPHSAPPHKMSMDSIPELVETRGDYQELHGLLPGLLSPTQQGSIPILSSRRPSCGVRMAEIRAGIRQGVDSLRGSGSICGDYPSRESLTRDLSQGSVRDSPRNSIIRESPRNSIVARGSPRQSPRGSIVRDSPEHSSDSSRDNSLRVSPGGCQHNAKSTSQRRPSLPHTPTSSSSKDNTPSASPRRLPSTHQVSLIENIKEK